MGRVSVGQVENLEDLVRGLESVRETLESACRNQISVADRKHAEAQEERRNSEDMLETASGIEQEKQRALEEAQEVLQEAQEALQEAQQDLEDALADLESAQQDLNSAESELSACQSQPLDDNGSAACCSGEEAAVGKAQIGVSNAQSAVSQSQSAVSEAEAALAEAKAAENAAKAELAEAQNNRQSMEQRVEGARQAESMSADLMERTHQECGMRLSAVCVAVQTGNARLAAAQNALESYLAANQPAASFVSWLRWRPDKNRAVTPDVIRDRINLSAEQQNLLQEYLYERKPAYRRMVDRYRSEWSSAMGDVERNIVNRKVRIHLSGEYAEQLAGYALAPLGLRVDTQGRTFVGDGGRFTKTDLIVKGLHVPVILGRGDRMTAPAGGSMAFEVKCGRETYLYAQKEHMVFQAEGHKQADAHCTLCSRDIHELPEEREKELRDTLRNAGSPMIGMLPRKNDIDRSCFELVRQDSDMEHK